MLQLVLVFLLHWKHKHGIVQITRWLRFPASDLTKCLLAFETHELNRAWKLRRVDIIIIILIIFVIRPPVLSEFVNRGHQLWGKRTYHNLLIKRLNRNA